ncbi:MAG: CoA transferase [Acidimicrobiales bacterium]|nr:CoA transferase [Acidimicrobiales bacterium]
MPSTSSPLTDLRVLEVSGDRGDLCGRLLADLGADVLLVEPSSGAASRQRAPFASDGSSLYFAVRNANKRSAVFDLAAPLESADLDRFLTLISDTDVLIESWAPGAMSNLGLGPDVLLKVNPELIVVSLTDFGQTGPDRDLVSTDDVVFALSGWQALSGIPEKPPLLLPGAIASDVVGVIGAYAVLVALVHRARGGGGQHLDVSSLEAMAQMNTWGLASASDSLRRGSTPPTVRSGDSPMYPTFECADGKVRCVVMAPGQWRALWEWMGSPEAFEDEYWESYVNRLMNTDVINPLYAAHWADLPKIEGCQEAQRRGVVATPLLSPAEVLADEHYASRGTFATVEIAPGVEAKVVSGAFEIDRIRIGHRHRAPEIGEDSDLFDGPRFTLSSPLGKAKDLPLRGLHVADFGHGGVGVECARMLADYGADVVKIESHAYPDFIRIVMGGEMSAPFASSSRTKRCLGLNLKHSGATQVVEKLVAWADILIENNSTGTMDTLGIGWSDVRRLNPDAVMMSSQLMGSHGIQANWTGYGPTIQTAGGLSWLWAYDDGDGPPGSNAIHPDHLAGRIGAVGALAALIGRDRGAPGAHVEVAQVEALMMTLADQFLAEALEPGSVHPRGNTYPTGAPWGAFPCAGEENWAVICVRDDHDWVSLREAMGDPQWARDPLLVRTAQRIEARPEVEARIADWTKDLTRVEVQNICQAKGVPAGQVMFCVDQLEDPHLIERGFLVDLEQQGLGRVVMAGPCFTGSGMGPPACFQAPLIGEHSRRFCVQDLGMDPGLVDELVASGALEALDELP